MFRIVRLTPIAALAAAFIAAPALAEDSPVLGSWDTAVESQMGKFEATMTVAEANDGYTVEIVDKPGKDAPPGPPPESEISDVVVDGNNLTFKRKLMMGPGQEFLLNYSATVEGDSLSGEAGSDFGAMKLTGTRSSAS